MTLKSKGSGFSLVELLAVLTILSVLATIGFPLTEISHRRAQEEDLRRSLREIRTALDEYKRLSDLGRIARPADASGYPPNLRVLVDGVVDAQSLHGNKLFLLRRIPRDPLTKAQGLDAASSWGLRSYASSPDDPQPGKDVYDVYSKAPGRGLDGTVYWQW